MCVLAPGLSLSIIIHSRVKIIDKERPGASPCDPRGRLHVHILRFHFLFHAEAANSCCDIVQCILYEFISLEHNNT
jgi:hypothetical protein